MDQSYSKMLGSNDVSKGADKSLRKSVGLMTKKQSSLLAPLRGQSSLRSSVDNSTYGVTHQLNDYNSDARAQDRVPTSGV